MNLVQKTVNAGGTLVPLTIPTGLTSGTGLMNPSIFIDDDGDILVNLRHVNYTLYVAENKKRFPTAWGPFSYLHPENDQRLATENYLIRLNKDLEVIDYTRVEMLELHTPIWEFVGLEDARLVQWYGRYYLIGVRRDTTTNGVGRMEISEIELDKEAWTAKEVSRVRMPSTGADDSYCEKNWMPIIDMPFHYIKWSAPTEIVKNVDGTTEQVLIKNSALNTPDQRGSSQVIRWGNFRIAITHEANVYLNYLGQKDGTYRHRVIVWDEEFNLLGVSKEFSFLDTQVEFCVGAQEFEDDLLVSFSFQDNAAFLLKVPRVVVEELILEALDGN
jgi:hypothetical protein